MKTKKQNGYTIELMVVFMLVTFAFCTLVTTFAVSMISAKKNATKELERQTTLNQIGEYYLRSLESGNQFPTLSESNFNDYDWINNDSVATAFFNGCKQRYTCETKYSVTRNGFFSGYSEKFVSHKLIVKSKSSTVTQMVVIVIETKDSTATDKATYDIKDWSITDIDDDTSYQPENLSLLQRLWMWLYGIIVNWVS